VNWCWVRVIAYRDGQPDPLLVATVPLGSLLPPGAALVMEGVEPVKLTYFLCAAQGCTTVATPLPPNVVDAMKKGDRPRSGSPRRTAGGRSAAVAEGLHQGDGALKK
jgi:invasion protein IalB